MIVTEYEFETLIRLSPDTDENWLTAQKSSQPESRDTNLMQYS